MRGEHFVILGSYSGLLGDKALHTGSLIRLAGVVGKV
jgi:hypothetical protein